MKTEVLVEGGMALALAVVFSRLSIARLPFEGEVSLEMVPLLLFAARRGVAAGALAGMVFGGLLKIILGGRVVTLLQYLLDYPVAFGVLGMAGVARSCRLPVKLFPGFLIGAVGLRFAAHWVSGVLFFAQMAPPGQPGWLYSLVYNATYMVPSGLAAVFLVPVILHRLPTAMHE